MSLNSIPSTSKTNVIPLHTHQHSSVKKPEPGVITHAYNSSTWEAETGGSQVQSQPQQLNETLLQNKIELGHVAHG